MLDQAKKLTELYPGYHFEVNASNQLVMKKQHFNEMVIVNAFNTVDEFYDYIHNKPGCSGA